MNYIERQVSASEEVVTKHWPLIRTLATPLQGADLYPMTERGQGRNSRAAWLLDTDAKIDMLAHVAGTGVFGLAVRALTIKDAFRPYASITFRTQADLTGGELQSLFQRARAGAMLPSYAVSVQVSESRGLRFVSVVNVPAVLSAIRKRRDTSILRATRKDGLSFISTNVMSLPDGCAWWHGDADVIVEGNGAPALDLLTPQQVAA